MRACLLRLLSCRYVVVVVFAVVVVIVGTVNTQQATADSAPPAGIHADNIQRQQHSYNHYLLTLSPHNHNSSYNNQTGYNCHYHYYRHDNSDSDKTTSPTNSATLASYNCYYYGYLHHRELPFPTLRGPQHHKVNKSDN